jgi:alpha-glucoside transport system permease protein
MSTASLPTTTTPPVAAPVAASTKAKKKLTSPIASVVAIAIAVLWTLPTFGLAVSSIRPEKDIINTGWWTFFTDPQISFKNYQTVLAAEGTSALGSYFVNSFVIVIPSTLIPLVLATFAAYVFAWVRFPGRDFLFVVVFALQIVPIQVTLLPLLSLFVDLHMSGTFWPVWLSHSTFALPLAIFLLHNFMKEIPPGLLEAARVDGAGHVAIFFRVLLPLLTPALAAFGIFQFLWTWNDLLVALTFAGGGPDTAPITVALANLSGTRGNAWHLLSAGAFVSIIVPVVVFLALQRYFVRGLLAGGLKG